MTRNASNTAQTALDAFHQGGGLLYPFRKGYSALESLIRHMPRDLWRQDEAVLAGLVLLLLKKGQALRAKSYLCAHDLRFEKTDRFKVLELLLALHLGEPVSDALLARWRRLERSLPIDEPLLLGLYYNAMMAMFVRLGQITEARVAGQQAISCYREDGHVYLEHFIHIHLADMDVIEGRLHRATQGLTAATRCLSQSGVRYGNEEAVIAVIRAAIDYERGAFDRVRACASDLRNSLLNGDSWAELFNQLARVSVLSAYFQDGCKAALAELADFQADYARRHNGEPLAMDGLHALIWQLEWHPDEAERLLDQMQQRPAQSAVGSMVVDELSCAVGRAEPRLPETPRARIVAALQKARTTRGNTRRAALERALRLAFEEGQIAPFLEHRDVFLGLTARLGRRDRLPGRLGRMTNRVLKLVAESYVVPPDLRALGFNARQYRVATALLSGASNKQIARHLGTTEATVKYHLTSLYKLAGVRSRFEFIDFAQESAAFISY